MKSARALIIDDDASTRFVLSATLRDLGLDVTAIDDGAEAPELVQHQHFDLLLVDLYMPGMNGFELLRQIRHDLPRREAKYGTSQAVPVVVISGEAQHASIENAKRLGASAYLVKPVDIEELAQTVRRVLDEP
jgi:CheY-like chemotaxis protein